MKKISMMMLLTTTLCQSTYAFNLLDRIGKSQKKITHQTTNPTRPSFSFESRSDLEGHWQGTCTEDGYTFQDSADIVISSYNDDEDDIDREMVSIDHEEFVINRSESRSESTEYATEAGEVKLSWGSDKNELISDFSYVKSLYDNSVDIHTIGQVTFHLEHEQMIIDIKALTFKNLKQLDTNQMKCVYDRDTSVSVLKKKG